MSKNTPRHKHNKVRGGREGYDGFESSQRLAYAVLHDCQLEELESEVICM